MQRHGSVVTADNAGRLRDALVGDWYAARAGGDDVLMVAARRPPWPTSMAGPVNC